MAAGDSMIELPGVPAAAGVARAFVRRCLSDLENASALEGIALCVSEMVTNALDHAAPPYGIRVARSSSQLRIEVADASAQLPVLLPQSIAANRGRGIFLVQCTATRWGVEPTTAGKTVWAEFTTKPSDGTPRSASLTTSSLPHAQHEKGDVVAGFGSGELEHRALDEVGDLTGTTATAGRQRLT